MFGVAWGEKAACIVKCAWAGRGRKGQPLSLTRGLADLQRQARSGVRGMTGVPDGDVETARRAAVAVGPSFARWLKTSMASGTCVALAAQALTLCAIAGGLWQLRAGCAHRHRLSGRPGQKLQQGPASDWRHGVGRVVVLPQRNRPRGHRRGPQQAIVGTSPGVCTGDT